MRIYSPLFSPGNYFFENFIQNLFNLETGNPFKENTEQNFLDSRTYLLFQTFLESLRQTVITEKKWKVSVSEMLGIHILYKLSSQSGPDGDWGYVYYIVNQNKKFPNIQWWTVICTCVYSLPSIYNISNLERGTINSSPKQNIHQRRELIFGVWAKFDPALLYFTSCK